MSRTRPRRQPARRLPATRQQARRLVWQIDMGDGTHAVICMACSLPLYRGRSKGVARQAAARHVCEPVVPLGRARRGGRR
jgi:hypothetical protein